MKQKTETGSMRKALAETLVELAGRDDKIWVVDADLKSSLGLSEFAQKFPNRFVEAGVAENNAMGVAAGLARTGKIVFVGSYACFSPAINWAVIKQSVVYNQIGGVKIIGSHAGLLTGYQGSSHQMLEDVALMRAIPEMEVFAPVDAVETKKIVRAMTYSRKPGYIRVVRPETPIWTKKRDRWIIGRPTKIQNGRDITVVGYGPVLAGAMAAQTELTLGRKKTSLEIIGVGTIKPLELEMIVKSVSKTGRLLVVEDHQKNGGLGEWLAASLMLRKIKFDFRHLGIRDRFGQSGRDPWELYEVYSIGRRAILDTIKKWTK